MKCLEFCERQGLALRGHGYNSTIPDRRQQGNIKGVLDFCVDADDQVLQEHLEMCSKNAYCISKATQKWASRMHQTVSSRWNHRWYQSTINWSKIHCPSWLSYWCE